MAVVYAEELCALLEGIKREAFEGVVYRFTAGSWDPREPNRSGARWNPRDVAALYAALDRDVALAEHAWRLAAQNPQPTRGNFTLYQVRVRIGGILDLSATTTLMDLGLSDLDIVDDDHSVCQRIGGAAAYVKIGGLIVPSARQTNGRNLVIFTNNHAGAFEFEIQAREPITSSL